MRVLALFAAVACWGCSRKPESEASRNAPLIEESRASCEKEVARLDLAAEMVRSSGATDALREAIVPRLLSDAEETVLGWMRPIRRKVSDATFERAYAKAFLGSVAIRSGQGRLHGYAAFFERSGWYCATTRVNAIVRGTGVTAEPALGSGVAAARVIFFDDASMPFWEVSTDESFALCDADGDGVPAELVRWSDTYSCIRPTYLIIHSILDMTGAPMLAIALNPTADQDRMQIEWTKSTRRRVDAEVGRLREKPPKRIGRWKFERNEQSRNDVVVDERVGGQWIEAARFRMVPGARAWSAPRQAPEDFWIPAEDPWVEARLVRFASLPDDGSWWGGAHGELNLGIDQFKAAKEAARKAGLDD